MFSIKTKTKYIETTADSALSLTFSNPAFDSQERAFSLPFAAIGAVGHNEVAELSLDGLPFMNGSVTVVRNKKRVSECAFKSIPTKLYDILATLKINEILPTIDVFGTIDTASFQGVIIEPIIGNTFYRFSVKGKTYENTYGTAPTHQQIAADMVNAINADYPGISLILTGAIYRVQFKNIAVYESLEVNWALMSNFTVITETYAADFQETAIRDKFVTAQADFCLPLFFNSFLYDLKNPAWGGIVNDNRDGVITENGWHTTLSCEHTFIPQVRFEYIIRKALDMAEVQMGESITLLTDAPHDQTVSELTLFNLVTIDNFIKEPHNLSANLYKNAYQRTINLNNHVPANVTALALIESVCELFQLYPTYKSGVLRFNSKRDQFDGEVFDLSEYADNNIEKEYKTVDGFTLAFPIDDEETFSQPAPLAVGGVNRIEVKAGTVGFQGNEVPSVTTSKKGTSIPFSILSKTPLRLFYYKGFQLYSGVEYPFGTPMNQLPDGTTDGVASIRWEGAQGLYRKAWQNVIETSLNATTFKITAWLTALQIIDIQTLQKPLFIIYTPAAGYRKGVLKQLQTRVRLRPQTRYECEIEIFEI